MGISDIEKTISAAPQAHLIATHMDEVCHSKLWRKDLRKYVCENALGQKILIPDDDETLSF